MSPLLRVMQRLLVRLPRRERLCAAVGRRRTRRGTPQHLRRGKSPFCRVAACVACMCSAAGGSGRCGRRQRRTAAPSALWHPYSRLRRCGGRRGPATAAARLCSLPAFAASASGAVSAAAFSLCGCFPVRRFVLQCVSVRRAVVWPPVPPLRLTRRPNTASTPLQHGLAVLVALPTPRAWRHVILCALCCRAPVRVCVRSLTAAPFVTPALAWKPALQFCAED